MIGFAFTTDPNLTFRVDSNWTLRDNEVLRGMVNTILTTIIQKIFLETWVLPSWRTAFFPLLDPTLEQWLTREEDDKVLDRKARPTISSRANQLWESTAPMAQSLLKRPIDRAKDWGEGVVFPISSILPRLTEKIILQFELPLVEAFITFATDATIPDNPYQTEPSSEDSPPAPTGWKTARSRTDVKIEKRRLRQSDNDGSICDMTRAVITVNCDLARTFSVPLGSHLDSLKSYSFSTRLRFIYRE